MDKTPETVFDEFIERAAIREYQGNQSREEAEREALNAVPENLRAYVLKRLAEARS